MDEVVIAALKLCVSAQSHSTHLFPHNDAPPIAHMADIISALADTFPSSLVEQHATARLLSSHASSFAKKHPHLVSKYLLLSLLLVSHVRIEELMGVASAGILDEMSSFLNKLFSEDFISLGIARKASLDEVTKVAEHHLNGIPSSVQLAAFVQKSVLLCSEGSQLYPNRIFVRSDRCSAPSILPALILTRTMNSAMRHTDIHFPCKVLLVTCSLESDTLPKVLALVSKLGVGVLASQRVICDDLQCVLSACGVISIERLSIQHIQPFSLLTNAFAFDELAHAEAATASDLGTLTGLSPYGKDSILCQGEGGRVYTLVVPLEGDLNHAGAIKECVTMCANLFAHPYCVTGGGSFEASMLAVLSECARRNNWRPIIGPVRTAISEMLRMTYGTVPVPSQLNYFAIANEILNTPRGASDSPGRQPVQFIGPASGLPIEPLQGILSVLTESLTLAATLLRVSRFESFLAL